MKLTVGEQQISIREAHLAREEELFASLVFGSFIKIKDWDEKGSLVIWEGIIAHPELNRKYKVHIQYGLQYPFRRPDVYPVEPRIINQRHQMPNYENKNLPGALCLLPHSPDYWRIGLTCHDIAERIIKWFRHYEEGTLGEEFAPPEIEVYFPKSHRERGIEILAAKTLLNPGADKSGGCLLFPIVSGKFAYLTTLTDQQSVEAKSEEVFRLMRLVLPDESLSSRKMVTGDWFRLPEEPKLPVPFNSAELMRTLIRYGFTQDEMFKLARRKPEVVALCYPTTVDQLHWLLFKTAFSFPNRDGFRQQAFEQKFNQVNKNFALKAYSINHLNTETIFRRVSGYKVEALLKKKCLLLGCGSIGSTVAVELIKAGVGSLNLLDKDELKVGNVCRHELGLNYLGENKAIALRLELLRKNPFASINTVTFDPLTHPNAFTEEATKADLIVSCLGNDSTEFFINSVCRELGKPVLFCRSYLEARLGEILLVREQSNGACFECAATFLNHDDCQIPRPPKILYSELVRMDGDCGTAFLPASSVDLGFVSLQVSRLALLILQQDELPENYWLIRGREFASSEFEELTGYIRKPFEIHSYIIPKSENCSACEVKMKHI